ncbi:MAG: hypothetical protein IJK96_00815 [Bacteroidales bacterium]|nr:hypothetical protein [Bacteroidales bacterium]
MKRFAAILLFLTLSAALLHSQEAETASPGAELTIVPRLDLGATVSNEDTRFTMGNTSLYSLFEGNFSENLSFSVENHWLAGFQPPVGDFDFTPTKDLYKYLGHSDWTNWLDWAYLRYDADSWFATVGKDLMYIGGLEFDNYDYEVHPVLMSSLSNNFACYQWQAAAGWQNETTALSFQVSTSPYGEHPFSSGLYNFGLKWVGEYGDFDNNWSFSLVGKGDGKYYPLVSLGQRYTMGDVALSLDYWNAVCSEEEFLLEGHSASLTALWTPSEQWEILVKGGYEHVNDTVFRDDFDSFRGGMAVHWFPVENLRIHLAGGYNPLLGFAAHIGAMFYLKTHIGR